ncbi:CDP-alcohol phosphatidyltransferase family protein [Endozoicomonas numazuensis]|uniref:CDP-alcohol phosphatidyltransferase family protein n=1 Tax=Endozoicomonas numazuensis TaxID=1137799 RepID=UPI00068D399B|nr:CDP-alcohol phosphatidyltransferase family protein [Endozoicomonas numazuensis]
MLDRWTTRWIRAPLTLLAHPLKNMGIRADQVTFIGFLIGLTALPLLAFEFYLSALTAILCNRLLDGLDGALARITHATDAGGYLDITLDFIFYSAIVLGFAFADPEKNALIASLLIFTFMGTGSSFLAYAIMAEKKGLSDPNFSHKSFYYLNGLAEGTETIAVFVLFCLFPDYFPILAAIFAVICILTTMTRVWGGYQTIKLADGVDTHSEKMPIAKKYP